MDTKNSVKAYNALLNQARTAAAGALALRELIESENANFIGSTYGKIEDAVASLNSAKTIKEDSSRLVIRVKFSSFRTLPCGCSITPKDVVEASSKGTREKDVTCPHCGEHTKVPKKNFYSVE